MLWTPTEPKNPVKLWLLRLTMWWRCQKGTCCPYTPSPWHADDSMTTMHHTTPQEVTWPSRLTTCVYDTWMFFFVFFHLTYLLDIVRRTVYFNILQLDWSILFLYYSVFLFLRFQKYSDSDFHMLACNIDIFILSLYLTHVAVTSLFLWIFDMPT